MYKVERSKILDEAQTQKHHKASRSDPHQRHLIPRLRVHGPEPLRLIQKVERIRQKAPRRRNQAHCPLRHFCSRIHAQARILSQRPKTGKYFNFEEELGEDM